MRVEALWTPARTSIPIAHLPRWGDFSRVDIELSWVWTTSSTRELGAREQRTQNAALPLPVKTLLPLPVDLLKTFIFLTLPFQNERARHGFLPKTNYMTRAVQGRAGFVPEVDRQYRSEHRPPAPAPEIYEL